MSKKAPVKSRDPSTEQLSRWVKERAFRRPEGLRLEAHGAASGGVVVSFPLPEADWRSSLTATEAAVASDILAGLSNADIARKRGTAVRTVANQVASIYRKLRVRSRLELSLYALAGHHTIELEPSR